MTSDIKVKKRNGRLEQINLDKINKCVERACEGLSDVNVSEVVLDASLQLYNKITTSEIDIALIMSAISKIEQELYGKYVQVEDPETGEMKTQTRSGKNLPENWVNMSKKARDKWLSYENAKRDVKQLYNYLTLNERLDPKKIDLLYKNVQDKYKYNYELTKNPLKFKDLIQKELISKRVEYVRIHSSGDFYSMKYLKTWIDIAKNNPSVIFYGYTKSVPLFQSLELPINFIFCFSTGGKMDHKIKPGEKKAVIFKSHEDLNKAKYTDCTENDMNMITTDKIGLVYH